MADTSSGSGSGVHASSKAEVRCEPLLASAGVNGDTSCLDWNTDEDVVAYAASCFVFFTRHAATPERPQRVVQTCTGHTARVNCVRWFRHAHSDGTLSFSFPNAMLVSGSTDKTLRIWKHEPGTDRWSEAQMLQGHSESVTELDARSFRSGRAVIASSAGDETVHLWQSLDPNKKDPFELLQVVSTPRHYMMALSLALLPQTNRLVLACGGDDMRVHLYTETEAHGMEHQDALQGHEDWIRSLDFATVSQADGSKALLLASGAQDCFIRLWKIAQQASASTKKTEDKFDAMLRTSERIFNVDDTTFCSSLDALLAGHENKVFSVCWSHTQEPLRLLSASADKTLVLWQQDTESGVWLDHARMGEVGGNTLGFFGGAFGPSAQHVMGHSFHGALHQWTHDTQASAWQPQVVVSGHFKGVYDLDWSPNGDFLLTCSDDQSTRLFAQWQHPSITDAAERTWHETARPQVHGYDMRCVAAIDDSSFASGADEKVLRVFEAPESFFSSFKAITGRALRHRGESFAVKGRAMGASVPALGLSNKPVYEGEGTSASSESKAEQHQQQAQFYRSTTADAVYPFQSSHLEQPPFEAQLVQNTLWPETRKLYGHGYELVCVACDHQRTLLASACKATKHEHAAVRLWSVKTGLEVAQLPGHKLTAVKLAFSRDDRWLVSVSRDRSICVYERVEAEGDTGPTYELRFCHAKAHDRIIWDVAWLPGGHRFITGSRDKQVKVWDVRETGELSLVCTLPKFKDSVTAVAVTTQGRQQAGQDETDGDDSDCASSRLPLYLAVGYDKGAVTVFSSSDDGKSWSHVHSLPRDLAHRATVRRLKWRPQRDSKHINELVLASCGLDHVVRINRIAL